MGIKTLILKYAIFKNLGPDQFFYLSLNDKSRNELFAEAIESKVSPEKSVLYLGGNSCLFPLYVSKAGAKSIHVLEPRKPFFSAAQHVCEDNDITDVTVLHKFPEEIEVGKDLPERPDVIVWECSTMSGATDSTLIPAIDPAVYQISKAETEFIPRRARVMACLLECFPQVEPLSTPLSTICGFDLSLFNQFRTDKSETLKLSDFEYALLSEPIELMSLEFSQNQVDDENWSQHVTFLPSCSGRTCHGVLLWSDLEMVEGKWLPGGPSQKSRRMEVCLADQPFPVEAGQGVALGLRRRGNSVVMTKEGIGAAVSVEDGEKSGEDSSFMYVARWHFGMLNDEVRNSAYDRAVNRAVRKLGGDNVRALDIGSGSGLLAMMAARAGAKNVTTVEMVRPLAELSKEIISANGYGECINALHGKSTDVKIGTEMQQKANMLVSEILDVGVLGEGVIQSINDALERLVDNDALVIPKAADVHFMLLECPAQPEAISFPIRDHHSGFNLRALNRFRVRGKYESIRVNNIRHTRLSPVLNAMKFDLSKKLPMKAKMVVSTECLTEGRCNAIAFWFTLHVDDEDSISTGPDDAPMCWPQSLMFLDKSFDVKKGDEITTVCSHDDARLYFDAFPDE